MYKYENFRQQVIVILFSLSFILSFVVFPNFTDDKMDLLVVKLVIFLLKMTSIGYKDLHTILLLIFYSFIFSFICMLMEGTMNIFICDIKYMQISYELG